MGSFLDNVQQPYAVDCTRDLTDQNLVTDNKYILSSNVQTDPVFSFTSSTATANNRHALLQRLNARKAQRETEKMLRKLTEKPIYLTEAKYITYEKRKRQEFGRDDKPVWPAKLEQSFQRAMIAIPPLGRKKRSQSGKPHGRNELISLWILQETGELRDRKQVSSHIQVLGKLLQGSPEWEAVTKPNHLNDDEHGRVDYYAESIEDMVRNLREKAMQRGSNLYLGEPLPSLPSNVHMGLGSLYFNMWAGQPHDVRECLHNYTHVHNAQKPNAAVGALEDVPQWRSSFPDFVQTVQNWSQEQSCDIILLRCGLKVMTDHPPAGSKLGMALELDFRTPGGENFTFLEHIKSWSSKTFIYRYGDLISKSENDELSAHEFGIVRPLLECAWWAKQFGQHTDRRRTAEDSHDEGVIAATEQTSRNFFKSITVLQEIYACTESGDNDPSCSSSSKKRMAVLLWTFAQTYTGRMGVTTWQKLLPVDKEELSFATTLSDTLPTSTDYTAGTSTVPQGDSDFDPHQTNCTYIDPGIDGDAAYSHHEPSHMHFGDLEMDLGVHELQGTSSSIYNLSQRSINVADFDSLQDFDYDSLQQSFQVGQNEHQPIQELQLHEPQDRHSQATQQLQFNQNHSNQQYNDFDSGPDPIHELHQFQPYSQDIAEDCEALSQRIPLANFDCNTHAALQAQLADVAESESTSASHASVGLDSQQSVTGALEHLDLDNASMLDVTMIEKSDEGIEIEGIDSDIIPSQAPRTDLTSSLTFMTPRADRPALFSHHSFAGIVHTDTEPLLDTPTRNDFSRLMAQLEPHTNDEIFNTNSLHSSHLTTRTDLRRPQSQPALLISDHHEINEFNDFEICNLNDGDWNEIKLDEFDNISLLA